MADFWKELHMVSWKLTRSGMKNNDLIMRDLYIYRETNFIRGKILKLYVQSMHAEVDLPQTCGEWRQRVICFPSMNLHSYSSLPLAWPPPICCITMES